MKYKLRHYLAHLLNWNLGLPVTEWGSDGYLWAGFKCATCGKVSSIHRTKIKSRLTNEGQTGG